MAVAGPRRSHGSNIEKMVKDIQVIGSPDEVRVQLHERANNGADVQPIPMPNGPLAQVTKTLELFIS